MSNIELIHFIKWKGFAVKRMKKTSKTKIKRLLFFVYVFFFIEPTYFDIWTHLIRIHSAAGRCCAYREKWISCLNIQTESGSANVWNKLDAAFCIYTHTHTRTPSHKILSIKERKEEKKKWRRKTVQRVWFTMAVLLPLSPCSWLILWDVYSRISLDMLVNRVNSEPHSAIFATQRFITKTMPNILLVCFHVMAKVIAWWRYATKMKSTKTTHTHTKESEANKKRSRTRWKIQSIGMNQSNIASVTSTSTFDIKYIGEQIKLCINVCLYLVLIMRQIFT